MSYLSTGATGEQSAVCRPAYFPGRAGGLLARLSRWRCYRRALSAMIRDREAAGYRTSPPVFERMRQEARPKAAG